jgi:RNA-directed DNA polymerase
MKAYQLIKANAGAAGVDQQSLASFDQDCKRNLYKLWNRMSSGSYFPPPVKAVAIPKKTGGERILGVPTVADRMAQMVVKLKLEPEVDKHFLPDSYGYRPNKSALDAVGVTRQRCWKYDWVVEFDIKGLFDNIAHDLLMKAVRKHTDCKWILLYIERWLKAPLQTPEGQLVERTQGTPQGGVVSPLLSNLFLHYVFDIWISRQHPGLPWCRYADDGLIHCKTEKQAQAILSQLHQRFAACRLALHPGKTKIVYCKDELRNRHYAQTTFDFLGYRFRPRLVKHSQKPRLFVSFSPAVSPIAQKAMRAETRSRQFYRKTAMSLNEISRRYNPVLRGWMNYYGRYFRSALYAVFAHFNRTLVAWAMRKYKKLKGHKTRAARLIERAAKQNPRLFVHWEIGMLKM